MPSQPKIMRAFIKDPQHIKRVIESVQTFNLRQDFMDLCFICARGHRVFAHKLLFCSVSTQLKEMFLELPDNIDLITVHLPDVEARHMRFMLEFLYEGVVRLTSKPDREEFDKLKEMLGIVLHRATPGEKAVEPQIETVSSTQQIPQQAVFYVQAAANASQGQTQYVLAAPATLTPDQMMQMTQSAQGQLMQVTQTASGQMVQVPLSPAPAAPQMVQVAAPATSIPHMAPVMTPANGQMIQGGSSISSTLQQNNVMQVVPPNNTQVVPMVVGNQMVQCSNQMVVQQNQPVIMNNNQNQTPHPAQRPQYVMASSTNQITTSRAQTQYTQPQVTPQQQIAARSRTTPIDTQPARTSSAISVAEDRSTTMQEILAILQDNCDNLETIEMLTARQLRQILEPRLGVNLSNQEKLIEEVLKSFRSASGEKEGESESVMRKNSVKGKSGTPSGAKKVLRRRKRRVSLSDDEDDEDYDPSRPPSRRSKKK